jgi:hypothetical protein
VYYKYIYILNKGRNRHLGREDALKRKHKTVNVYKKQTSGHESQRGLETKTETWLTGKVSGKRRLRLRHQNHTSSTTLRMKTDGLRNVGIYENRTTLPG